MELPRDLQKFIVRKLDIDTRRTLGIYSKLRIPFDIRNRLEACIRPRAVTVKDVTHLWLGKIYFVEIHSLMRVTIIHHLRARTFSNRYPIVYVRSHGEDRYRTYFHKDTHRYSWV
jgi:hypothetical protein